MKNEPASSPAAGDRRNIHERRRLPPPTLQGEEYLYAIASELRDLNDKLDAALAAMSSAALPALPPAGEVELREPRPGAVPGAGPARPAARPSRATSKDK